MFDIVLTFIPAQVLQLESKDTSEVDGETTRVFGLRPTLRLSTTRGVIIESNGLVTSLFSAVRRNLVSINQSLSTSGMCHVHAFGENNVKYKIQEIIEVRRTATTEWLELHRVMR